MRVVSLSLGFVHCQDLEAARRECALLEGVLEERGRAALPVGASAGQQGLAVTDAAAALEQCMASLRAAEQRGADAAAEVDMLTAMVAAYRAEVCRLHILQSPSPVTARSPLVPVLICSASKSLEVCRAALMGPASGADGDLQLRAGVIVCPPAVQVADLRAGMAECEKDIDAERGANAALWEKLQAAGYARPGADGAQPGQDAELASALADARAALAAREAALQVCATSSITKAVCQQDTSLSLVDRNACIQHCMQL